jgi:hypothetical protein
MIEINNHNIYIYFNKLDEGEKLKTITIHTPNDEEMDNFIKILKSILKKHGIINTSLLSEVVYKKTPQTNIDYIEKFQWYDMPEFKKNDKIFKCPFILLHFQLTDQTLKIFDDLNLTKKSLYLWYPSRPKSLSPSKNKIYICPDNIKPKYPIYIISKGRYEKRMTSKYLEASKINYKIVIEPQEYEQYSAVIDPKKILILPNKYLNKNQGGIPARNFVLDHSIKNGDARHWILDDNIPYYTRLNNNERRPVFGGVVFKVLEDYVDRYTNIKMAGHNYHMFGMTNNLYPIIKNTRIYSSILLSNDIVKILGEGWRGRYNEDTDLSLRILKKGYPTILFNNFLANKQATLHQKGGNTDSIYAEKDALYKKAHSLQLQHPDVSKIVVRFGRTHHMVDYTGFKDLEPIYKKNIKIPHDINNYGMTLIKQPNNILKGDKNLPPFKRIESIKKNKI